MSEIPTNAEEFFKEVSGHPLAVLEVNIQR